MGLEGLNNALYHLQTGKDFEKKRPVCKNCGHKIEELHKDSFIKKYKDKSLWCHVRHRSFGFNPLRECNCGCKKPEPIKSKR